MTNMWKIITEPKVQVQKICNECGKVIETFDSTHPLTQYMIFDLQAHIPDKIDLDKLDFGLQPYHWCPIKPNGTACLVPLKTIIRETQQEEQDAAAERRLKTITTTTTNLGHAPFKPTKSDLHPNPKGRPPKTVLKVIEELKEQEDDSTNSV